MLILYVSSDSNKKLIIKNGLVMLMFPLTLTKKINYYKNGLVVKRGLQGC